jgi:excisionase family DNA binding protein
MPRGRRKKSKECATFKVPQMAGILNCGEDSVRKLIAKGTIPHLRFGRNIVVPKHAFFQWLESVGAKENGNAL